MSVQATFAATLVDEWARAGVEHAVVAPGSRSTPLGLALAADGRLRLHVHHDERAAAFTALGVGLATGRPAVVLTTSGTAAVELHPAVVEACHARVPLLACTADRPPELHDVGAAQTVDQAHLFGRAVRWFSDPGVPRAEAAGAWRSLAARAVAEAAGSPPGPVHLNLPFTEPLVAERGPLPSGRPRGRPWHTGPVAAPGAGEAAAEQAGDVLAGARRGVIVAGGGAGPPEAVHALAAQLGWPVLADPRSGCRLPEPSTVAAFDALLRVPGFAADHRPDAVLRLGAPLASKVLAGWLAVSGAPQVVVDAHGGWWDPDRMAAVVVTASAASVGRALDGRVAEACPGWARSWQQAEARAQAAIDRWVASRPDVTEPAVARTLVAAVPDGATLVVASSMPVRDVEWYAAPRTGVRVLANRGANGIDGVVSTAVGVALAGEGPVAALVGDLAFLHDANALLGLAQRGVDLTVVVVDNRGGGIFSFLPQARALPPERFELLFGTPHHVDLVALARAHGLPGQELDDLRAWPAVLAGPRPSVVVARTDRAANVAAHDDLNAAVAAAL